MRIATLSILSAITAITFCLNPQAMADITLIDAGKAHCAILVSPDVMAPGHEAGADEMSLAVDAEKQAASGCGNPGCGSCPLSGKNVRASAS